MQELLGKNLTEFIKHYLTKSGVVIKQNEIYFETKDRINRGDVLAYLKDMCRFARYYAQLLNPELEKQEKVRKYLLRLNRLEVATIYPFLLNCYEDWRQSRITDEELVTILQILENFILRRFVCNLQIKNFNIIFALLYSRVSKATNLASATFLERLKLTLQSHDYPKDSEFEAGLMDVKLYGGSRSDKAKLILESIEESFNHKEKVSFDELTIEHIMPKTVNDWWRNHLGEDWAITHELLVHSLGNLTLTGYNSTLSNDDFLAKKAILKDSHLELNKYFHDRESWSGKDIETRASNLTARALEIWSYFGDETIQIPRRSSVTGTIPKMLCIFGKEYPVRSWRDVMETTMNVVADLEPEKFQDIIQQYPRFIGWNKKDLRETRQLKNRAFIEVDISAKDIYAFCSRAIQTAEISLEEWKVDTQKNISNRSIALAYQ